jgi:hypothetical protein
LSSHHQEDDSEEGAVNCGLKQSNFNHPTHFVLQCVKSVKFFFIEVKVDHAEKQESSIWCASLER